MRWSSKYSTTIITMLAVMVASVLVFLIGSVISLTKQMQLLDEVELEIAAINNGSYTSELDVRVADEDDGIDLERWIFSDSVEWNHWAGVMKLCRRGSRFDLTWPMSCASWRDWKILRIAWLLRIYESVVYVLAMKIKLMFSGW